MAAERRKEAPSLPPDYVSFAQLKKLWLQKQEEKKLKQKQEDDNKVGLGSDGQGKMVAEPPTNVTEGLKEKGKGKAIDGFENAEEKKMMMKRKKPMQKKKTKHLQEKKSAAVECRYASEKGKAGKSGCQDVQTNHSYMVAKGVSRALSGERSEKDLSCGEWNGTGVADTVAVIEVLPMDAEKEQLPRVEQSVLRGGRGITPGSRYRSKENYRFKWDQVKETEVKSSSAVAEDDKLHGNMWRRKGNGHSREKSYRQRATGSNALEAKEVEMKSEKKTKDEFSAHFSGIQSLNAKDKERISSQRRDRRSNIEEVDRACQNDDNVSLEKKVEDVLSGIKSVKLHEKRTVGDGDGRYRNSSENNDGKFGISTLRDGRAGNMRSRMVKNVGYDLNTYANSGRFGGSWKMKQRESSSLVWLKKGEKLSANAAAAAPLEFQQIKGDQTDEKHFSGGL